ncbi:MAG: tetratricopeptide repeat protein [Desulfovibrionaceae bacterium]
MTNFIDQIDEASLKERICELKDRQEFRALADYLISVLSSGRLLPRLRVKAYNELGVSHLQLDEPGEAEKAFLSAIDFDPKAVNPRFNLANLALYARKYEAALEQYREVLALDPNHVGARYHSGLCLAMTDRPDEALPCFEASAKAAPDAMGPHFWAGEVLLAGEGFEFALPYFLKAIEISPDHRESRRGVAICLFELGDYEQCIEQCDMLIISGGGAEYLAFQIKGDALVEMGEIEAAAFCHLELADMDFDARDYLVMRARELAKQHPEHVARYVGVIVNTIPELERAFSGIVPASEQAEAVVAQISIPREEASNVE